MYTEKYLLMHKNTPVLTMLLEEQSRVKKVIEIHAEKHLPINMFSNTNKTKALTEFMTLRAIPKSRDNLDLILKAYHAKDPLELSIKSYQLSLTDHYWVKPIHEELHWDAINFFNNPFKEDSLFIETSLNLTYDADVELPNRPRLTPNVSLNGSLPQMWRKEDNQFLLLKSGRNPYFEPLNEVLVSRILDKTNVEHVRYELKHLPNGEFLSACPAFTDNTWELIPAWQIMRTLNSKINRYDALIKQCERFHIPNAQKDIDTMIAVDYLTINDDRHWGNFGFLRNSETLEFKGIAPLFDHGNTLWYNKASLYSTISSYSYKSVTFNSTHEKQLKHIKTDLTNLNLHHVLDNISQTIQEVYEKNTPLHSERAKVLEDLFTKRAVTLLNYLNKKPFTHA